MRKIIGSLFVLAIILSGIGFILQNAYKNGLCFADFNTNTYDVSCGIFWGNIGSPVYYGMMALALIFAILLIFPYAFKAWQNFALWFLPLAVDIFATYTGPGRGYIDVTPDSVTVFKWLGGLYVLLSLIIITLIVYRKKYGKQTVQKNPSQKRKIIFWSLWALYVAIIIGWHFLIKV